MKISFIVNHNTWGSIDQKVKNICSFFSTIALEPTVVHTYFDYIPFVTVPTSDGHQGSTDTVGTAETISTAWYELNIVPLAPQADIIVFCISDDDKKGHITPAGIDDKNHIIIFGQKENDRAYVNGVDVGNDFELFCMHEISHALYSRLGKPDRTHEFFYAGNPKGVLPDFVQKSLIETILDSIRLLFSKPLNDQSKKEIVKLETQLDPLLPTNSQKLYDLSYSLIGHHLSLNDAIPASFGCAQAVSYVLKEFGAPIPSKGIDGTVDLSKWLKDNCTSVSKPDLGDIIISVTQGDNHGHVGIVGKNAIMSNDSQTGLWQPFWSLPAWITFYQGQKKLVTQFYKI
jgi:hypothetical protein